MGTLVIITIIHMLLKIIKGCWISRWTIPCIYIAYIPLYSLAKRGILSLYLMFIDKEPEYFEDGTANREDSRYQAWLRMYHPDVSFSVFSPPYKPAEKHGCLGNFVDSSSPDRSSYQLEYLSRVLQVLQVATQGQSQAQEDSNSS